NIDKKAQMSSVNRRTCLTLKPRWLTECALLRRREVGLLKTLDERLNLGRISFRNLIAFGHPRSPRAQSRPSANIGQARIGLDSLLSRRATAGRRLTG